MERSRPVPEQPWRLRQRSLPRSLCIGRHECFRKTGELQKVPHHRLPRRRPAGRLRRSRVGGPRRRHAEPALSADASNYHLYVSPTGSDANPAAQPVRSAPSSKAAKVAKPSTTVHVAPGTYRGNVATKTTAPRPARIRYVSDTKWGAKIVGSGTEGMWTNQRQLRRHRRLRHHRPGPSGHPELGVEYPA